MRASELYIGHPELMTAEEREESEFVDIEASFPMFPLWYRDKLLDNVTCVPDEEGKAEFLKREPALGMSSHELELLRLHAPSLLPVQHRLLFNMLQNSLASNLISCDGAASLEELFSLLESELKSGKPAPIPAWYKFERARERGFGYHVCAARDCFATEHLNKRFGSCGGCRVAYYCGLACQTKDWKERHKFVCEEAKRIVGKDGEAEYFLKMMQDPNVKALLERVHVQK
jgi:hypothetical protein